MEKAVIEIIQPVLEETMVLAGQYAKACGRDCMLSKDFEYCLKYCAMNSVGKKIGSHFPDMYDEEESDEEIEVVNEEDEESFQPYEGASKLMNNINEAYNQWENWEPTNPSETILKNAIDSNEYLSG